MSVGPKARNLTAAPHGDSVDECQNAVDIHVIHFTAPYETDLLVEAPRSLVRRLSGQENLPQHKAISLEILFDVDQGFSEECFSKPAPPKPFLDPHVLNPSSAAVFLAFYAPEAGSLDPAFDFRHQDVVIVEMRVNVPPATVDAAVKSLTRVDLLKARDVLLARPFDSDFHRERQC